MSRTLLALAFSCITVSVAVAKDVCVAMDDGPLVGSQLLLRKAKLGPGNVALLQGWLARFNQNTSAFDRFYPLSGESIVDSTGKAALGILVHNVPIESNVVAIGSDVLVANASCLPGTNGKIGTLDSCSGLFDGNAWNGHVVDCGSLVAIP